MGSLSHQLKHRATEKFELHAPNGLPIEGNLQKNLPEFVPNRVHQHLVIFRWPGVLNYWSLTYPLSHLWKKYEEILTLDSLDGSNPMKNGIVITSQVVPEGLSHPIRCSGLGIDLRQLLLERAGRLGGPIDSMKNMSSSIGMYNYSQLNGKIIHSCSRKTTNQWCIYIYPFTYWFASYFPWESTPLSIRDDFSGRPASRVLGDAGATWSSSWNSKIIHGHGRNAQKFMA